MYLLCFTVIILSFFFFFFFNDTATTEIYTLSLHDALPISISRLLNARRRRYSKVSGPSRSRRRRAQARDRRSEEHTSELQSRSDLVCRLLLEKKKKNKIQTLTICHIIDTDAQPYRLHADVT